MNQKQICRRVSRGMGVLACASAIVALWMWWQNREQAFLTVQEPNRDLGDLVIGEDHFFDVAVHNSGSRPLWIHGLANDLC